MKAWLAARWERLIVRLARRHITAAYANGFAEGWKERAQPKPSAPTFRSPLKAHDYIDATTQRNAGNPDELTVTCELATRAALRDVTAS